MPCGCPRWYTSQQAALVALMSPQRDWLLDEGSLTRRLKDLCPGQFAVDLVSQRPQRPLVDEVRALALRPGERVLVREVYLYCAQQPLVFARTLIPRAALRSGGRKLERLGNQPLGELLFAHPQAGREQMEITRLAPRHALYHLALRRVAGPAAPIWARRTRFRYFGAPLLVNEVFLPGLFQHCSGA